MSENYLKLNLTPDQIEEIKTMLKDQTITTIKLDSAQTTVIKFVLIEADCNTNQPLYNDSHGNLEVLTGYRNRTAIFADSMNFDISQAFNFENYDHAYALQALLWDVSNVATLIAIWDSRYPDEIDTRYVSWGKEKNEQVKANRESDYQGS